MTQTPGRNERQRIPRWLEFALFLTSLAWVGAAASIAGRAAQGLTVRFGLGAVEALLEALFLLFLAVLGFRALDWIATRGAHAGDALALPRRTGAGSEWGVGAAIGWGLCLLAVLPLLLSGHLHMHPHWPPGSVLWAVLTLATAALAEEAIFRGYPFQRLTGAVGPTLASILLSGGFAVFLLAGHRPLHFGLALADGLCFGLLLAMAYLRTRALWVGWGLHFAYRAVMGVLLGLPIAGRDSFGSIGDASTYGPRWLTGGSFGLDAALWTAPAFLLGLAVLYRATRDYAWLYTHPPIVAAGYEVNVAPPPAHTAMERAAAAAPPPLVQILATTPGSQSPAPPPPPPLPPPLVHGE